MLGVNNLLLESSSEEEEQILGCRRRKIFRLRVNFQFESRYECIERFRMSPDRLEELAIELGPTLQHPSGKSGALTPRQQVCIGLHWLGSGSQYHIIADTHGVSKATVCRTIKAVVTAINDVLFDRVVTWPDPIGGVIENFYRIANFPMVCGIVDGSLVKIDAPNENEAAYVDRHGEHSINCMFICGPKKHFYYVSARWPGSVHDARVFRNSTLFQRMEEGVLFPDHPNAVIIGDSAYPLKVWLMPPRNVDPQDQGERRYNRRLKATRQVIECSIGILKEKFPCLNYLRVDPLYAGNIVTCCSTLCNFSRDDDEQGDGIVLLPEAHNVEVEADWDVIEQNADEVPVPAAVLKQQPIVNSMRDRAIQPNI